jgi:serine/threonine protein kinase
LHPHLMRLFDSGVCQVGPSRFRYFVTELADTTLAAAIAARELSADETREMLQPILQAAAYLHDRGLAHGRIRPANILKVGDSYKLSVDSVRPGGSVYSAANDMRSLGLTIIEALTKVREPSLIASLSQPFQDIVEGLLQTDPIRQWTAKSVAAALLGEKPVPAPPSQEVPRPVPSPAVGTSEIKQRPALARDIVVYSATALLLLAAFLFVLFHRTGPSSQSATVVGHNDAAAPVSAPPDPLATRVTRPASQPRPDQAWCVVVGSYTSQVNAARQAEVIARKWPEFHPRVLPPSADNIYYLVSIGSGLSADTAKWWRDRAVALGFSRDTYIKLYPRP